jgi:hypothetical protein
LIIRSSAFAKQRLWAWGESKMEDCIAAAGVSIAICLPFITAALILIERRLHKITMDMEGDE